MDEINGKSYWDARFREDWESKDGRGQSRFFSRLALELMPSWLKWTLTSGQARVLDWGCALGDGTELLAQTLDGALVEGCDFSAEAIEQAARTYPLINFIRADVMQDELVGEWDFVFSSNTLEHFHQPWNVLDRLGPFCKRGAIVLIPFEEFFRIEEHYYTFQLDNVPVLLGKGFVLAYHGVADAALIEGTQWAGQQILLVYLRKEDELLSQLKLGHTFTPANTSSASALRLGERAAHELSIANEALLESRSEVYALKSREVELEGRVEIERSSAVARIRERDQLQDELRLAQQNLTSLNEESGIARIRLQALDQAIETAKLEDMALRSRLEQAEAAAETLVAELSNLAAERDQIAADARDSELRVENLDRQLKKATRTLPAKRSTDGGRLASEIIVGAHRAFDLATQLNLVAEDLIKKNAELSHSLHAMRESRSWRLTHLLRSAIAAVRGVDSETSAVVPTSQDGDRLRLDKLSASLRQAQESALEYHPLGGGARRIYIFTGVPYDDIGGGQRAAQIARVLLQRGEQVTFVYAYKKWEGGQPVESSFSTPGLEHVYLGKASVESLMKDAGPQDVMLVELPHPAFLDYFRRFGDVGATRAFELIDAWDSSLGGDWFSEDVMQFYVSESEMVVGTARVLQRKLFEMGRDDALYLPNAANDKIFDSHRSYPTPVDYKEHGRRLLYFGSLYGEWFDWDSVNQAALACGDGATIYLIGDPPLGREVHHNVVFLGSKAIEELPAYLYHCDASLLPFIPGHISDAVSPIKVFEYLAMGVPVIANALPELVGYPNVYVAATPDEFASLCVRPLTADRAAADAFVVRNTWAFRADAIVPPRDFGRVISVIVLMHNNATIIGRCIDSLFLHGGDYVKEVIVVDNDSSDDGFELVRRDFPDVKLIRNERNGCSSGRNLGVRNATGDVIAFFDSDQWVTSRGCFEEALALLSANPGVGAVGWAAGWFSRDSEHLGGPIADYLPERGTLTAEYKTLGFRTDIAYLGSGGMFLYRDVFDRTGGFDEGFDPTCFEDTDFSLSIKKTGLKIAYRDLQGVRHEAHQTTSASGQSDAYKNLFLRNSNYMKSKWSAYPQFIFDLPGH